MGLNAWKDIYVSGRQNSPNKKSSLGFATQNSLLELRTYRLEFIVISTAICWWTECVVHFLETAEVRLLGRPRPLSKASGDTAKNFQARELGIQGKETATHTAMKVKEIRGSKYWRIMTMTHFIFAPLEGESKRPIISTIYFHCPTSFCLFLSTSISC